MSQPVFIDEGNALKVQRDQFSRIAHSHAEISDGLESAKSLHDSNALELAALIAEAEKACKDKGIDTSSVQDADMTDLDALLEGIELEKSEINKVDNIAVEKLQTVNVGNDWSEYLRNIHEYAEENNIDLSSDPFDELLTPEERREIVQRIEDEYKYHGEAHCDKLDYALAALCGVISGLVDAFFVGMPGASKLGSVVDKTADKAVEKFAHFTNWCDKKYVDRQKEKGALGDWKDYQPTGRALPGKIHDVEYYKEKLRKKFNRPLTPKELEECEARALSSSIGYLQDRFNVPYDARYAKDLINAEGKVSFNPKDHHLKSFAHSCDPIGLFFSILDQFTGKTTIISEGKIKRFIPQSENTFRLQGTNFYTKVLFGFINWFGHLMSDAVGSGGTRGHVGKRGAGIAAPFFELFQLCDFGSIDVEGDKKTLAQFTSSLYENGYDARFAATQAIPVALNEVLIRLCWSIKRHYYHKLPWKNCVPLKLSDKPELRRMLLVGHGCLCIVDAADAAIRSWGNLMKFALHLNFVAWARFARIGYLEIRALYKKDALNIEQMETDLKSEWESLLAESEKY